MLLGLEAGGCGAPVSCCILSHWQLAPSFSGTAAIAPIIAAVKDGKSITYEGREVRRPVS